MIWQLWAIFVGLSLIMIVIGLSKPTESAQALIGFTFLFLLSFVVLGNNLEFQTGELRTTTYTYSDNETLIQSVENITLTNSVYDDTTGFFNTQRFGYFMAVASVIGFIGVLVSLRGGWKE